MAVFAKTLISMVLVGALGFFVVLGFAHFSNNSLLFNVKNDNFLSGGTIFGYQNKYNNSDRGSTVSNGSTVSESIKQNNSLSANMQTESIVTQVNENQFLSSPAETTEKYAAIKNNPEVQKANRIVVKDGANPDVITIGFAGDILFDRQYAIMSSLLSAGGDITRIIEPVLLDKMKRMDVMIVNNEFPYSNRGTPIPDKTYTFRADPEYVKYLGAMGVDGVSIANNHAFDYGEQAFLDTLDTLEAADMPYAGGGRNIGEAARAMTFLVNDRLISILCATQIERLENPDTRGATMDRAGVFRCLDATALCEQVRKYKETSDVVIVFTHWGTESTDVLDFRQTGQAKELMEAGADLVVGAHPHVLQGVDYLGDMPVVYSLGNFAFSSKTLDGAMLEVQIIKGDTKDEIKARFIPTRQAGCQAKLLTAADKDNVINYINSISGYTALDSDGYLQRRS